MSESRKVEVLKVEPHGILGAVLRFESSVLEKGADQLDLEILSLKLFWKCREPMSDQLNCDAEKDLIRPMCVDAGAPEIFSWIQRPTWIFQVTGKLGVAVKFVSHFTP